MARRPALLSAVGALCAYSAVIMALTMFKAFFVIGHLWVPERQRVRQLYLIPFESTFTSSTFFGPIFDAAGNIAFFAPFGVLLTVVLASRQLTGSSPGRWSPILTRVTLGAVAMSILIEVAQFLFRLGRTDITDVIFNAGGAAIGALVCLALGPAWHRLWVAGAYVLCAVFAVLVALGPAVGDPAKVVGSASSSARILPAASSAPIPATLPATGGFEPTDWGNDPTCVAAPQHPRPVVLIPGTWGTIADMDTLGRHLRAEGHCVYSLTYGRDPRSLTAQVYQLMDPRNPIGGTGDIPTSTREINAFLDLVLTSTTQGRRAGELDLLGHSQGGAQIRLLLDQRLHSTPSSPSPSPTSTPSPMPLADAAPASSPSRLGVERVVMLGATNHGTTLMGMSYLRPNGSSAVRSLGEGIVGVAAMQQLADSAVAQRLRELPDTVPGVDYTVVASEGDMTATPPRSSFLKAGPGAAVRNVMIQDVCPAPPSLHHEDLITDPLVLRLVASVLAGGPAQCSAEH